MKIKACTLASIIRQFICLDLVSFQRSSLSHFSSSALLLREVPSQHGMVLLPYVKHSHANMHYTFSCIYVPLMRSLGLYIQSFHNHTSSYYKTSHIFLEMRMRTSTLEKQGTCKPTNTRSISCNLHVLPSSNMSSSPLTLMYILQPFFDISSNMIGFRTAKAHVFFVGL